jgi:hypothetical protein
VRRLIPVTAVLIALGFAACGGGDETSSPTPVTAGATGAQGATGPELTASEFVQASIPDEIEAVKQAVADNPDCAGADTAPGSDFQVSVAIDAASAEPDTPISEIVADNC